MKLTVLCSDVTVTGINLRDCFRATGAYQQESLGWGIGLVLVVVVLVVVLVIGFEVDLLFAELGWDRQQECVQ